MFQLWAWSITFLLVSFKASRLETRLKMHVFYNASVFWFVRQFRCQQEWKPDVITQSCVDSGMSSGPLCLLSQADPRCMSLFHGYLCSRLTLFSQYTWVNTEFFLNTMQYSNQSHEDVNYIPPNLFVKTIQCWWIIKSYVYWTVHHLYSCVKGKTNLMPLILLFIQYSFITHYSTCFGR